MVEVFLEHFTVPKRTQYGTVQRSTGQDKVYVKNDLGVWKHCGYLLHESMTFLPLIGVPQELVVPIADQCAKQKNATVQAVPSIPLNDPEQANDDEYEYDDIEG